MTKLSILKYLTLWSTVFLLAESSLAAIYRPIDPAGLIDAVQAANITPVDDIIDLRGQIFEFLDDCDGIDNDADPNCTADNALPIIEDEPTGGRLSIINGAITRNGSAGNFRFIQVAADAELTLFNITLRRGSSTGGPQFVGGAILNLGTLALYNCTLTDNGSNSNGGAIFNGQEGLLSVWHSDISGNSSALSGGGINNVGTIAIISHSTIADNIADANGGGISNSFAINLILDSTISGNTATLDGGGIYHVSNATTLRLVNATVTGNIAERNGGGIYNASTTAPAINDDIPPASNGVHIYNSTISGNSAVTNGGGIYQLTGSADIAAIISTIIAGNTATLGPDFYNNTADDAVISESHNLIGDNTDATDTFILGQNFDIVGTSLAVIDPKLAPLADNGGFTLTLALLPGSPALNLGLNSFSLIYDQRGTPYRRVICSRIDIGAFERQGCI